MTSFDTLYLRLEHSKMPAITDSNTANDPANKQSMGNNDMDMSFCKFSMELTSSSLKLISKGKIDMSQILVFHSPSFFFRSYCKSTSISSRVTNCPANDRTIKWVNSSDTFNLSIQDRPCRWVKFEKVRLSLPKFKSKVGVVILKCMETPI